MHADTVSAETNAKTRDKDTSKSRDDKLTIMSIAALACILQDVLHEGLGHGVTAWLSGARQITISTVALQSDISTRWISANGTMVNLIFGGIFWLILRSGRRYPPATRYFLVLAMAGNLFTGTGYFLFSGVSNFGDWADVIHGLQPHLAWQLGLVALGALSYYASMLVVAAELKPFRTPEEGRARLRGLCWTPYFTDALLAALGSLLNPLGWFLVVASALPSTMGANAGMLSLPSMIRKPPANQDQVAPLTRNLTWIIAVSVASLLFVFVLGRGITWTR